jgi:hypothetical protein
MSRSHNLLFLLIERLRRLLSIFCLLLAEAAFLLRLAESVEEDLKGTCRLMRCSIHVLRVLLVEKV